MKRELLAELRGSYEEGKPLQPEDVLQRWPGDLTTDPDVASLLFQDFQQRQDRGDEPSIDDYDRRFPQHKDSLAGLLRNHGVLRSMGAASTKSTPRLALPAVGDELFGFRLRHELGRGAFARVFLAEQSDLAGRPVVLKVSSIEGNEPQTLAQLQHTHIVPIYSVHENAEAGLRAVCMPYFGGASLSRVLQGLWNDTKLPSRGEEFVESLGVVSSPSVEETRRQGDRETGRQGDKVTGRQGDRETGNQVDAESKSGIVSPCHPVTLSPCLELLRGYTYLQAAAWIVARLAEGLQHAHDRGVLHRDIKPSNILVGSDGQPMLLNFNLSQQLNSDQAQAMLGGTIAYMAPEHLRALATRDPAHVKQVDRRADIYSLGMVLYEMLAGHSPFDQSASYTPLPALIEAMALERGKTMPSLRTPPSPLPLSPAAGERVGVRGRPDAPWSLESIVRKCLAPDPAQRYQRAEQLAEDLRCFLGNLPLKHAPELSQTERVRKWLRRHPRAASTGSVATAAAILLIGVCAALLGVREHLVKTRDQLEIEQSQKQAKEYEAGTERALCLVNTRTDQGDLQSQLTGNVDDHLRQGLKVCERTLALYDVLERDDWQSHPLWRRLNHEERLQLAEDTRELLLLLASARVRTSPGDRNVLRQSLALLDRAEGIQELQPSRALSLERASYLHDLDDGAGEKAALEAAEHTPCAARVIITS